MEVEPPLTPTEQALAEDNLRALAVQVCGMANVEFRRSARFAHTDWQKYKVCVDLLTLADAWLVDGPQWMSFRWTDLLTAMNAPTSTEESSALDLLIENCEYVSFRQ